MVRITVTNIFDERPVFSPASSSIVISEKQQAGAIIYQLSANDPEVLGLKSFVMNNSDPTTSQNFIVEEFSGIIRLAVGAKFDAELTSMINLYFYAEQLLNPVLKSNEFKLEINIADVNDKNPFFANTLETFEMEENSNIETIVGRITAIDLDTTDANKQLTYFALNNMFSDMIFVDPSVGFLIGINPNIDRETHDELFFTVCATDSAVDQTQTDPNGESRTSCTNVLIDITDQNDNAPQFQGDLVNTVSEKLPVGSVLIKLSATDLDEGINGQVKYKWTNDQNEFNLVLNEDSGSITLNEPLDYEVPTGVILIFSVTAYDLAVEPLETTITIFIFLEDTNDNSPVFQQLSYAYTLFGNETVNTSVGSVSATDLDVTDQFRIVEYSIYDPRNLNWFRIDSTTGDIYTNSLLITQNIALYTFIVRATDMVGSDSTERRQGSAFVSISIGERNTSNNVNTAPYFTKTNYQIQISEKYPTSEPVFQFHANDNQNSALVYEFSTDDFIANIDQLDFQLTLSGELKFLNIIDSESLRKSTYTVYVKARETGIDQFQSSQVELIINVFGVNDNSPIFAQSLYQFEVNEGFGQGHIVGNVSATDADAHAVFYAFSSNIYNNLFTIDSSNGQISLTGKINCC